VLQLNGYRSLTRILKGGAPGPEGSTSKLFWSQLDQELAELATEIAQVRLLVRWVASLTDEDPQRMLPQEASMAKLAATELAKRVALEGVQIMGGYGYATEYPMERYLRSAVVGTIYGGTSEIQKNIIAKTLGL